MKIKPKQLMVSKYCSLKWKKKKRKMWRINVPVKKWLHTQSIIGVKLLKKNNFYQKKTMWRHTKPLPWQIQLPSNVLDFIDICNGMVAVERTASVAKSVLCYEFIMMAVWSADNKRYSTLSGFGDFQFFVLTPL